MDKFHKNYRSDKEYYNNSHLSICGRASELASQAVSHFIKFTEKESPYCVFCLQGVEDINRNKIKTKFHYHEPISLEGARIG